MRKDQFDGVRFFLFMCVFSVHHAVTELEFLGYALPVFFVMSGFLITRILMGCTEPSLTGKLRTFYIRRIIRVFPAYYVFIVLFLIIESPPYMLSYIFYYANLQTFFLSINPEQQAFADLFHWWQHWEEYNLHIWSLCVEEQYYLVYPFLFYAVPDRYKWLLFFGLVLIGIATRTYFLTYYPDSFYNMLLPSNAEYFAWGGFFGYYNAKGKILENVNPTLLTCVSFFLTIALIGIEFYFDMDRYFQNQSTHFVTPISFLIAIFLLGLWRLPNSSPIIKVLCYKPFVYLGVISYPMYLVHLVAKTLYRTFLQESINQYLTDPALQFTCFYITTLIITFIMGALIWHLVEVPANKLKRFVPVNLNIK